jgi:hypothetical protein
MRGAPGNHPAAGGFAVRRRKVGPVPVTCAFCGSSAEAETPPLTWTSAVENGRTKHFCERCSRENLRAIESKLDSDWW